jgi:hypothetical protein
MVFGFIRREGGDHLTLTSTKITGDIVDCFATLEITQEFWSDRPATSSTLCMVKMEGYIVFDIRIEKPPMDFHFDIKEILAGTGGSLRNTEGFAKSVNDISLSLGALEANHPVILTYGCIVLAKLKSPKEFEFELPFNSSHRNTPLSMSISVVTHQPLREILTPELSSTFVSGQTLEIPTCKISSQPIITLEMANDISSMAVAKTLRGDQYIGLGLVPSASYGIESYGIESSSLIRRVASCEK